VGDVLHLHEVVDIVGQGARPYMEDNVVGFDAAAAADRALRLFGTWEVVGATGRWPQVVNLWELADGWQGWRRLCESTNLRRAENRALGEWWDDAYRKRTGGFDRLLRASPDMPGLDQLVADDVNGSMFVHELTEVRPGAGARYLRAVREEWAPIAADHGHHLVGAWEVLFGDTEVITVWATDLDGHIGLQEAEGADDRIGTWRRRSRKWTTRWHEELMTPHPGTPLAAPRDPA
jgi:hypothetical protein